MPSLVSAQQTPGAAILGTWATLDGRLVVEFYDAGPAYAARFIYGDLIVEADGKTLKKDLKNPDPSLRSRSLADVDFVSGLVWDVSERRWENGVVYQANAGRTGSAHATVEGDTLNLRAYRGLPVAGRTIVFKRRPG
ncbi:DUF2147 domain-containing protein [Rhizobium sp. NFR07]|uniref:DUF2147 domain-containing protein n=1 Tax=Rhizobium sp. NFR07 TaxID=1566262 RepID=UPI001FCDA485|nr:DUF2147 domain-containing protein [Rhizobium sp. NFR07]